MNKEIKDYSDALEAHMAAKSQEIISRVLVTKTHHRLLMTKDALRSKEIDILSDMERS